MTRSEEAAGIRNWTAVIPPYQRPRARARAVSLDAFQLGDFPKFSKSTPPSLCLARSLGSAPVPPAADNVTHAFCTTTRDADRTAQMQRHDDRAVRCAASERLGDGSAGAGVCLLIPSPPIGFRFCSHAAQRQSRGNLRGLLRAATATATGTGRRYLARGQHS
uniref:Uncharacterized protein n=1 Tax=Oryza punctata TaxID=4537 RepID=A0A0E0K4G8_ORYPU